MALQDPRKLLGIEVKAVGDDVLSYNASDATADRDGDIVHPKGWMLEDWKKNPVFLWSHLSMMPPIGKGVDSEVGDKFLRIDVKMAKRGQDYDDWPAVIPSPETAYKMYKGGFLNAVSVGFTPVEHKRYDTPEARQAAGLGPWGVEYLKQKLLELSGCSVPSNPNALQLAVSSGLLNEKEAETWLRRIAGDNERLLEETVEVMLHKMKLALSEKDTVAAVRKMLGLPGEVEINVQVPLASTTNELQPSPSSPFSAKRFRELWGQTATTVK